MSREEVTERLLFVSEMLLSRGAGFCPECGVQSVDEDYLCGTCGATANGNALRYLMADIKEALG